jgi:xanthine dehydrogenase accessory factor
MEAFLQPFELDKAVDSNLLRYLKGNQGCILITPLSGEIIESTLLSGESNFGPVLPESLIKMANDLYNKRTHGTVTEGDVEYFVQIFPPRSKIVIIGAAHITADLIKLASQFDFETIVIDPRKSFAKNTTFPVAPDMIFENYPSEVLDKIAIDPYTYCVILSHDPKIDDDALKILLRSNAAYIGALGSKKNHEKRTERLLSHGFAPDVIGRIDAPIGLNIQAKGAKEIALSILGAIIKAKNEFSK